MKEAEPAAPVVEDAALAEAEPAEAVAAENGTAPVAAAVVIESSTENGTAESNDAEAVSSEETPVVSSDKRKSDVAVSGDGDGPDSTEVVAKKAKLDEDDLEVAPVETLA